jgi:hypothetical protein
MTEISFRVRLPGILRVASAGLLFSCLACFGPVRGQSPDTSAVPGATHVDADTLTQLPVSYRSDFSLFRDEYARLRTANPDSVVVTRADAVASEAEIQTLLGETDQAFVLWREAFDLLSTPAPDTTLDSLPPRQPR